MVRPWLAVFVFGQYFSLSVWFVALGPYMGRALGFDGVIGLAYASQGLAAIMASMIVGVIADRYLAPRKLLGLLMIASAATLVGLASVRASQPLFLALTFLHFVAFIPTIPLSNAICFDALAAPDRQFARIRAFGTLGWIVGGLLVGIIPNALLTPLPMHFAAGTMLLLSLVTFALPAAPVRDAGHRVTLAGILGLDALASIRHRAFWIVAGIAALSSIPLAFYNAYCTTFLQDAAISITLGGRRFEATAIQALGQVSELGFLLALPFALRLVGIRGVLLLGLSAWILRATCFILVATSQTGLSPTALAILGILLHGMCYDFMLIGAALFVDRCVRAELRARSQSFLTLVTMGIGVMVGSLIANAVYAGATLGGTHHDWRLVWGSVAGFSALALAILLLNFRSLANPDQRTAGAQWT
jgi:nucleoside transporter